jgi:hypothetical protein
VGKRVLERSEGRGGVYPHGKSGECRLGPEVALVTDENTRGISGLHVKVPGNTRAKLGKGL